MHPRADGQEVLIIDGDEKVRRGLSNLLVSANLVPTAVGEPERAVLLSREKFFAVALIDLDTPRANEGLGLVSRINANSPATTVLMMSSRKSFEVAVSAFRAGAVDVIVKAPDQVPYLQERVVEAANARARLTETRHVIEDVLGLHEELMQQLLTTYRRAAELTERVNGGPDLPVEIMRVLLVDPDGWLAGQLAAAGGHTGFEFTSVSTGGEALDAIGRQRFEIALVRDALPDLPGSMVVRGIKGQSPETIALLYTRPTTGSGSVDVFENSRVIPFLPEFGDASQILNRLDDLRQAFQATARERRYLASFRQEHFALLKRYAELKQKLQRTMAIDQSKTGLPGAR